MSETTATSTPKVAIVTGAAQGIGRATALQLWRDGLEVLAVDRQAEGLSSLESEGQGRIAVMTVDVTDADAPERVTRTAIERFGRLDALVNNAGIGKPKSLHLTSDEELDRFVDINFRSVFRFCRAAMEVMKPGATIVNVASTFGLMGNPGGAPYAATKAALIGLTRQMVADYGPAGYRINAVAPGVIATPMVNERLETNEYFRRLMVATTPYPRVGRPEDVADAISFLCSDKASFVNGHVLVIDGGWSVANYVPA